MALFYIIYEICKKNLNQEILVLIRRDGNISHLFISLATQRSMGEARQKGTIQISPNPLYLCNKIRFGEEDMEKAPA